MPQLLVALYVIIVILSVGISGYLSYEGLESSAGEVTFYLVAFIMLIIFLMDLAISYYRHVGKKAWILALCIWSIAAFFSISSHFNFLYTTFMKDDVEAVTVAAELQIFRDDLAETKAILLGQPIYAQAVQTTTDLKVELDNLERQISDPLRPGCGEECQVHLRKIESILGRPVTNLAIPPVGSDPAITKEWYVRYSQSAQSILDALLGSSQSGEINQIVQKIDELMLKFPDTNRVIAQLGGIAALSEMASSSEEVARLANSLLPADLNVVHQAIDPSLGRLGEIAYSFQNGFVEMPNPIATFVSLILGAIVDILPLMIAFALFGKGRLEPLERDRATRGPGGRTIIS